MKRQSYVFGIDVWNAQQPFHFCDSLISQRNRVPFFVNAEVCRAGEHCNEPREFFVQVRGFSVWLRDDKRSSRLINQYRINFINNCVIMPALNFLAHLINHVVSQIIKTKFAVDAVNDVGAICLSPFYRAQKIHINLKRMSLCMLFLLIFACFAIVN